MNIKQEYLDIISNDRWDILYEHVEEQSNFNLGLSIAQLPQNRERNRYNNVLPYDYNRIILKKPHIFNGKDKNEDFEKPSSLSMTPDSAHRNYKFKTKWFKRNLHKSKNSRNSTPNLGRKSNHLIDNFNDYINASLVQFSCSANFDSNLSYILTQGPLLNTSSHFWLMVWQQNSHCIIMLNKIIERNSVKCHSYYPGSQNLEVESMAWPQNSSKENNCLNDHDILIKPKKKEDFIMDVFDVGLQVIFLRRECKPNYIITIFELKEVMTGCCREIWHFQYTAWPDFGVPKDNESIIEFMEHIDNFLKSLNDKKSFSSVTHDSTKIRMTLTDPNLVRNYCDTPIEDNSQINNSLNGVLGALSDSSNVIGPPIIHCSAGIGRTGTYCLINFCIFQFQRYLTSNLNVPHVDIVSTLIEMRKFRAGLVQTSEQFKFAYGVIVHIFKKLYSQHKDCPIGLSLDELPISNQITPSDGENCEVLQQPSNYAIPPLAFMDEDLLSQHSPTPSELELTQAELDVKLFKARVILNTPSKFLDASIFSGSSDDDQETTL